MELPWGMQKSFKFYVTTLAFYLEHRIKVSEFKNTYNVKCTLRFDVCWLIIIIQTLHVPLLGIGFFPQLEYLG